jgi:hypothetical protein
MANILIQNVLQEIEENTTKPKGTPRRAIKTMKRGKTS